LWLYFNPQGSRSISACTFFAKLGTIIRGSQEDRIRFLFEVTDLDRNGALSVQEVEGFLVDFRELCCDLAVEVAAAELEVMDRVKDLQHPCDAAEHYGHLDAATTVAARGKAASVEQNILNFLEAVARERSDTEGLVDKELAEALRRLDADYDGKVTCEEWLLCGALPAMYGRLASMFVSFVDPQNAKRMEFKGLPVPPATSIQLPVPQDRVPLFPEWKPNGENTHVGNLSLNTSPYKTEDLYGNKPLVSFGVLTEIRHANLPDDESTPGITHYHSKSLRNVAAAVSEWNDTSDRNLRRIVCLGNLVDAQADEKKAVHELAEVVFELDKCRVPVHYVLGNHDVYQIPRDQLARRLDFDSPTKAFYWIDLHQSWRLIVLDSVDICVAGREVEHANTAQAVGLLRNYNKNRNMNEAGGLDGLDQRFVATNGGISQEQLLWLGQVLQDTAALQKRAVICTHMPLHPEVADAKYLLWNYDEVLKTIHAGRNYNCVAAVFSGHERGGYFRDSAGVHHVVIEGMVECAYPLNAFGLVELYHDKIQVRGKSMMSSCTLQI